ncbi:MAG: hypothetical protein LBT74_04225 [Acidobacteriota bacterium]|jgi:hypothetical protein|nr:hypothetical protein [Acidobacteriota bacterium]
MNCKKALSCLALLSLVFCAACGGPGTSTPSVEDPALSPEDAALKALLPESGDVAGWARGEEVRFFDADGLYEFINGAAENFLIYGFEKVVTADYSNPDQPSEVTVEIYQMKDPRNTFGVYASERNPESNFKPIGAEGYVGGTALNFWAGKYYARLTTFQESEALQQEMEKLAAAINKRIGDTGALSLPEAELFPKANQVPHSIRYLAKDVLGQVSFAEGFEANYKDGDKESRVVIVLPGDEAATVAALDKYKEFVKSSGGAVAKEVAAPGDGGFVGEDKYEGNLAVLRSGERLFISLGESSPDKALAQAAACIK